MKEKVFTMGRVVIMSGVSGSGKSTLAYEFAGGNAYAIVSADNYFLDIAGIYKFNPKKLQEAHNHCFRAYMDLLRETKYPVICVDNTNTSVAEIAPYMLAASAYGWEAEVHTVVCECEDDLHICAERNAHGVPYSAIQSQYFRLRQRQLLPWWKSSYTSMKV